MNTPHHQGRRHTYQPAMSRVPFRSLVSAEFHRSRQTRSTLALITIVVGIALIMLVVRAALGHNSNVPLGAETVTLSADIVGFAVLLATALAVARDHQTGAIDLLRTLTPTRARQLVARATGTGILALIAVGTVIIVGILTVLAFNPAAFDWTLADTIARTTVTMFCLAWAGVGIGAITRSTAAATFAVITLYWLLPIGLTIAGFAGATWAPLISDLTLGALAANAITPGFEQWASAGGIALWAAALSSLGILRETKGT